MTNKKKIIFHFVALFQFFFFQQFAQTSNLAMEDYKKSNYQTIDSLNNQDAIIIFNRYYIEVYKGNSEVYFYETFHRKIKINTSYAIESFNKLYIQSYEDLHFASNLVSCKVKTLKPDGTIIETKSSSLKESSLPANIPFFHKKEGKVKMLAIEGLNIGDEIEYIYKTRKVYAMEPKSFFRTAKSDFSFDFPCFEKSVFFYSKDYSVQFWPYNFHNGLSHKSNFGYNEGSKISLNNIEPIYYENYSKIKLTYPYIYYVITNYEKSRKQQWDDVIESFNSKVSKVKKSQIYDGLNISEMYERLAGKKNPMSRYEYLLEKINSLLEKNIELYNSEIDGNIDVAWYYAKNISKLMKKLNNPVQFNFVTDRNSGRLDKEFASYFQFDKIIISFVDREGEKNYITLLEPYSSINEISQKYQNTECFTIDQDVNGDISYSFSHIPKISEENRIHKKSYVKILDLTKETVHFLVTDTILFQGDSWLEMKSVANIMFNNSKNKKALLKDIISKSFIPNNEIDSVNNMDLELKNELFMVSFSYYDKISRPLGASIFGINPNVFFNNDFSTPYIYRNKRFNDGFLFDSPEYVFELHFNIPKNIKWLKNIDIIHNVSNSFGMSNTAFSYQDSSLVLNSTSKFIKDKFDKSDWEQILEIRDCQDDFLNSNLYFQIQ